MTIGSHPGAQVESERAHFFDGVANVFRRQPTGQKQWDADIFPDGAAERPIVRPAGTAQFFDRELLVAGIEQDGIHVGRDASGLLDRLGTGYVDDLNHRNPGQGLFQIAMGSVREMVAQLDGIGPTEALLLDDRSYTLP